MFEIRAATGARRRLLTAAVLLFLAALLAFAPPALGATVSDDPDPAPQTNGRVSDVLKVGDRVYLAGTFSQVNGQNRSRLAAVDADTGNLLPWAPRADKWVMTLAASEDGGRIYAGGRFTRVSGNVRGGLVALDANSGAVVGSWSPAANGDVRSLAAFGGRLYAGGAFTTIDGQARSRLAAVDAGTGSLTPWSPAANNVVRVLKPSPDGTRLYAGGYFNHISGIVRRGLGALDPTTGAVLAYNPNPVRPVLDLDASATGVFTAEGGGGGGEAAGYSALTGSELWSLHADGDAQAVALAGGEVFVGGHFVELGGQTRRYFAAVDAATGALDPLWVPRGAGGGVWSLEPDVTRNRLYAGGDFTSINGLPRQGFAQFSG